MPFMTTGPMSPVLPQKIPRKIDNKRGILLMLAGMFLFAAADMHAKLLTASFNPLQIVWCRQLGLVCGVLILLFLRGRAILKTNNLKMQVTRGAFAATSATLFIVAVAFVPLGDAVAVSFVAPFMVTLLGAWLLKEKVGIRRWSAVVVGFVGMLIIVRPGTGVVHPAVGIIVVAALFFALRQIISRYLSDSDRTETTIAYTAIVSICLLTIPLPFVWIMPSNWTQIGLLVSLSMLAAGGELLVIKALECAQAVVVAPVQYSLLIWGTFYGYWIFGQLPDRWTWLGALILVATGIYTLHRDSVAGKARTKTGQ